MTEPINWKALDDCQNQNAELLAALGSLADSLENIRMQIIGLEDRVSGAIEAAEKEK